MNPAATYDIETENWDTFVVGAIHHADGRTEIYRHDREREMAEALLNVDGEVWAHNGGRFDHLWLLDQLADTGRTVDVQASGAGIVALRVNGSDAVFLDSFRVFPFTLETLTGGAKKSLAHLCQCGKDCGGWCAVRRDMSARVRRVVEEYLTADVVELMRALEHFRALAESWGIEIKRTLGATAWRAAEASLGIERATYDMATWRSLREGYLGGRAEVFRRESPRGRVRDVNSMYPWALCQGLPVGVAVSADGSAARKKWRVGKPGVYRATVRVPEMWIPPLPLRTRRGLVFPVGRFTGTWPLPELEYAESLGVEVERIHSAVAFQALADVFSPWIAKMFVRRMEYGKQTREGKWIKWVTNSVSGKLGSRAESHRLAVYPDLETLSLCQCDDYDHACICGGFRPLDIHAKVWEQKIAQRRPEPCSRPEWAAYLTGYARVRLHQQLVAGGDDAVYCDTDSCWAERQNEKFLAPGDELGQWADGGEYRDFEALGPKTYRALVQGTEVIASKGIPAPKSWAELRAGVPQHFGSFAGLRRAGAGRFFRRLAATRRVTPNTGRRRPGAPGDPRTYPAPADEIPL